MIPNNPESAFEEHANFIITFKGNVIDERHAGGEILSTQITSHIESKYLYLHMLKELGYCEKYDKTIL